MKTQRIILPLLNEKVTTIKGPSLSLGTDATLRAIDVLDQGAFLFTGDEYRNSIGLKTRCVYITEPQITGDFETFAKGVATKVKFLLNNFKDDGPILIPFAALIVSTTASKCKISEVVDVESIADLHKLKKSPYKLRSGINLQSISEYAVAVSSVCEKVPEILFTLERYNQSLVRTGRYDRIVDQTICLESMIHTSQEVSFKFSLYLSLIAMKDPADRARAFTLFQKLYNARSKIVHGDINEKDLAAVETDWEEIKTLTASVMTYYILFLFSKLSTNAGEYSFKTAKKDWKAHLDELLFGLDKRFTD